LKFYKQRLLYSRNPSSAFILFFKEIPYIGMKIIQERILKLSMFAFNNFILSKGFKKLITCPYE